MNDQPTTGDKVAGAVLYGAAILFAVTMVVLVVAGFVK
jgi:hypothetical protein